jgi:hypothetical protein
LWFEDSLTVQPVFSTKRHQANVPAETNQAGGQQKSRPTAQPTNAQTHKPQKCRCILDAGWRLQENDEVNNQPTNQLTNPPTNQLTANPLKATD